MSLALKIRDLHPDYDVYFNNCQNFVRYLLEFVCPQKTINGPSTIQETLQNVYYAATLRTAPHIRVPRVAIEVMNLTVNSGCPQCDREKTGNNNL
jgi:hypothetical protein